MYHDITLSASMMCANWLNIQRDLLDLEAAGIDYLHYDILDGNFVPDFTMGSSIIDVIKKNTTIPSDYHLMVEEPSRIFDMFSLNVGDYFSIHQESSRNLHRDLASIKRLKGSSGVALSPGTNLDVLDYIIEDVNVVTIMTVNPGYKGQPLVPHAIKKIENLRKLISDLRLDTKISVDGNVNPKTIPDMVAAGANILVLGSSGLFRSDRSIAEALEEVHAAIDAGLERR
jgi:ribulose-phosphate 3-epimerase